MNTRLLPLMYLGACGAFTLLLSGSPTAQAACALSATAGDDANVCDSGNSAGLTDLAGNNRLQFTPGGTGIITGNVAYGAGNDEIQMDSGTLDGSVNQGDGANIFKLFNGQVTGTITQGAGADVLQVSGGSAGAINQGAGTDTLQVSGGSTGAITQGAGIDDYVQSGGTVASLAQGDGLDIFKMTGGTITGAFEDGDHAEMLDGTIGRVDMKLDNNIFDMRGGTILGNLVTGFGEDTILVSGGRIGGNISTSGGTDIITVSGGVVVGQILASAGDDHFTWKDGGQIQGNILLGIGSDTALLQKLTESTLGSTELINGGSNTGAVDVLTFDNTQSATPNRYTDWEVINLDNNTGFTLEGTLFLGGVDSSTGTLNINGSSELLVRSNATVRPFASGALATVNNRGLIDMTNSGAMANDVLRINGNYIGDRGQMALQSTLAGDGAASDKLVVSGGTMQGDTAISVANVDGAGAMTQQNGIQVVEALNGATGSDLAFTLRGGAVARCRPGRMNTTCSGAASPRAPSRIGTCAHRSSPPRCPLRKTR